MRRGYLSVDGRAVHYRTLGAGPPLVMLHGSPGDSAVLADEMAAAAPRFTCIALDAPGFGDSDPLPGETLTVADLAGATAAAMAAMGLPPCPVYGTHTGAAIALELGVGWPQRATGLVLEGVPVFTPEEMRANFSDYFAPMVPDPLGGHLTSTWMRFRDQFTWFPWPSRDVRRLNPFDRPTPDEIELWVSMFYRSCKTYAPAYHAACFYGEAGLRAAAALTLPCVYFTSAEDMLSPHLDRLPPLKPGQRIARLPHDPAAKYAAIVGFAAELAAPSAPRWTPPPGPTSVGHDPTRTYVDTPTGQVFVRSYGDRQAPATILVHDSPSSGLALGGLARRLAGEGRVIVPDLPASGRSDAPSTDASILDAAAGAVSAVADAFGLSEYVVGATGRAGAAVAATCLARGDPRLVGVALDAPPSAPDATTASLTAPDLSLSPEGAHWIRAWLMVRDGQIYSPWWDGRVAAQRRSQGEFGAAWLHDQTVELMRSRATCGRLAQAAATFDTASALANATVPVHVAPDGDLGAATRAFLFEKVSA